MYNEFTGNNNDIIKNRVLENDNEIIGSDNEMFVCIELERKCRESIFVKGIEGVEFSFNFVVGGEVKSSRIFKKDELSLIHI